MHGMIALTVAYKINRCDKQWKTMRLIFLQFIHEHMHILKSQPRGSKAFIHLKSTVYKKQTFYEVSCDHSETT